MAGGLFRKLLGSPAFSPEVREALAALARVEQRRPTLAGPAHLLRDLLPLLYEQGIDATLPALSAERATAKLVAGLPLLRHESLSVAARALGRRLRDVCVVAQRHQAGDAARKLAEALRRNQLDAAALLQEVLAGRPEAVPTRADELGLDTGVVALLLRFVVFPLLSRTGDALAALRQGVPWGRGYCPTCGSWPLLSESRGLEQRRFLRCGWCASGWESPRLFCPYCGNRDHRQLGYLHVEGEESQSRAATCDACRGYLKTVSVLAALSGPKLLVADVASMHLDLMAAERGYLAPPADTEGFALA